MKKVHFYLLLCTSTLISSCVKDPILLTTQVEEKFRINTYDPLVCFEAYNNTMRGNNLTDKFAAFSILKSCLGLYSPDLFPDLITPPTPKYFPPPPSLNDCSLAPSSEDQLLTFLNISENSTIAETDAAAINLRRYNEIIIETIFHYDLPEAGCPSVKVALFIMNAKNNYTLTPQEFIFFSEYVNILYSNNFFISQSWVDKLYWEELWIDDGINPPYPSGWRTATVSPLKLTVQ